MKRALIIIVSIAVIFAISIASLIVYTVSPVAKDSQKVYFEIKQGEGAYNISKKLQEQGLIRNSRLFVVLAKHLKYDRKLLSGYYELNKNMSMIDIMKHLNSGKQAMVRLTIAEGKNIYEIANYLETQGFTTKEEFLKACHDKKILERNLKSMQACNSVSAYDDLDVVGIDKSNSAYSRSGSCCGYQ